MKTHIQGCEGKLQFLVGVKRSKRVLCSIIAFMAFPVYVTFIEGASASLSL